MHKGEDGRKSRRERECCGLLIVIPLSHKPSRRGR